MDNKDRLLKNIEIYEKKIEVYKAMIAEWRNELGTLDPTANAASAGAGPAGNSDDPLALVKENEFFSKSQPEAAKLFLERVGHPLKTAQIIEAIEKGGVKIGGPTPQARKQNFSTILSRSAEFGLFKRDTYGLTSWPGIKKTKDNGSAKDEAEDKEDPASDDFLK